MLVLEQNFEMVPEQHTMTYWLFASFFHFSLLPVFIRNDSKDNFDSLH